MSNVFKKNLLQKHILVLLSNLKVDYSIPTEINQSAVNQQRCVMLIYHETSRDIRDTNVPCFFHFMTPIGP